MTLSTEASEPVRLERVVIRFAGDSGDGMQLTGDRFTHEAAAFGNDLATQPNFPAEIRAPQGTLPGVSSFQIRNADYDILTAGDRPDVLVAMNPAALKANATDLPRGAMLIVNTDEFTKRNLSKVGYDADPLTSGALDDFVVHAVCDDVADRVHDEIVERAAGQRVGVVADLRQVPLRELVSVNEIHIAPRERSAALRLERHRVHRHGRVPDDPPRSECRNPRSESGTTTPPATCPAGPGISAGKFGCVARSFPNAGACVNR